MLKENKLNAPLYCSKETTKLSLIQKGAAKVDAQIFKLEKEIFDKIGLSPIEITDEFVDSYSNKMHKRN